VGVVSKCEGVDNLYGEVVSRLGFRIRGSLPTSKTCGRILSCVVELASKLNLPDDVVREAEKVVSELSMRGFKVHDIEPTVVAIVYLVCRLKGFVLPLRYIAHVAEQMGWHLDRVYAQRAYKKIVKYISITPPPQSREQAELAKRMYRELVRSETVREVRRSDERARKQPVTQEQQTQERVLEQPPTPFHVAYIRSVAERLKLPEAVVEDAVSMVERVGVTGTSVVSGAIYLSCLKHGVEIGVSDLEGSWDVGARMLIEALGLADARSFLAVRAYKRIISWAEAGRVEIGRFYVRHIPRTEDGVVELKWMEFMSAFDVFPVMMSNKVSEELVKMGIATIRRVWTRKFIAIDLSKLKTLIEQLGGERVAEGQARGLPGALQA
jgi:transcription initiation factor TFIIIB Brf1 subunit/transcription initiation factor TFIIB